MYVYVQPPHVISICVHLGRVFYVAKEDDVFCLTLYGLIFRHREGKMRNKK